MSADDEGEAGETDLDKALTVYADAETRRSGIPVAAAADRFRPEDPDSLIAEMVDVLRRTNDVSVPPRLTPREDMTEKSETAFQAAFPELGREAIRALANRWAFYEYS